MIPAFLISSAISFKGNTKRDYELMTMMRTSGSQAAYIGRDVLPDAIQSVKQIKSEIEDEDHNDNVNPNFRDYFFCSECETSLGILESYFASKSHQVMENGPVGTFGSKNGYGISTLKGIDPFAAKLFFLSVFWRVSIAGFLQLKLIAKVESKLRRLVLACLGLTQMEVLQKIEMHKEELIAFPMIIMLHANDRNKTKRVIYSDKNRFPYFIMLNRYIVFLYENSRQVTNPTDGFFGLSDLIDKHEFLNVGPEIFNIGILTAEQSDKIQREVVNMMIMKTLNAGRISFSKAYEYTFGHRPSDDIIYTLLHRITHNNVPQYDRFSEDTIFNVTGNFMLEINNYFVQYGKPLRYTIGNVHPDDFKMSNLNYLKLE